MTLTVTLKPEKQLQVSPSLCSAFCITVWLVCMCIGVCFIVIYYKAVLQNESNNVCCISLWATCICIGSQCKVIVKLLVKVKFLCLHHVRLAKDVMFLTSLFVCLYVRCQTCAYNIFENELILLQTDTSGPREWNVQLVGSGGQRSGSHDARVRFGYMAEASFSFLTPSVQ